MLEEKVSELESDNIKLKSQLDSREQTINETNELGSLVASRDPENDDFQRKAQHNTREQTFRVLNEMSRLVESEYNPFKLAVIRSEERKLAKRERTIKQLKEQQVIIDRKKLKIQEESRN